jgi:hypothetical protein
MDFFWEYIRDVANSGRVVSLPGLRGRITAVVTAVPVDVLSRVWGEVQFRFDVCGAHIGLHYTVVKLGETI